MGRESRANQARRKLAATWGPDITNFGPPPKKYPAQPLRSEGLTEAERDLARLCRETFLSPWSYPNLFRAEILLNGKTISKEVCDLLIVFGNDVLIFSDKDCVFPASGDIDRDWSRWYRRAVDKSAQQIYGAERVIRSGVPLYIDAKLQVPFPLPLPDATAMRVHRILVAHGASARCRQALGGNGTLMIVPSIVGEKHFAKRADGGRPFAIGRVDATKGFIHVLDDASLVLLLRVLDTAPDLIRYLTKKEDLIMSGRLAFAAGEEALLGRYLAEVGPDGDHDFDLPADSPPVALDESGWHRFATSSVAARKAEADRVSYFWDHTIELFAKHFREGTADHLSHVTAADHAQVLYPFAQEGRLHRRILAKALIQMHATTPPNIRRLRVVPPMQPGGPYWVLLLFPYLKTESYEYNRDTRRAFLEACVIVTKLMYPDAQDIAAYATESGRGELGSEDALYVDVRDWTAEMDAEARRLQREFNILTSERRVEFIEHDYPH